MSKIIVYPNFAGVDIKGDNEFNYPVEKISLTKLIINEKFKDEKHFSSVEIQQQLDKMSKKLDELPPILIIKHPLLKEKYSILDGHHRFQLFKTLKKDMIPAQIINYKDIFLAKNEYGTKNNKAVRLDKIDGNEINLEKYFNTDVNKEKLEEKWSEKYKKSINCNNPKGFSQRAHCQGKKKNMKETEILKGGLADQMSLEDVAKKHKLNVNDLKKEFDKGVKVEMEHTDNKKKAEEITKDHLYEDPKYYSKLNKIETKEMTGADSSGSYVGPMNVVKIKKKDINKINNWNELQEALDASASGEYDVPFGGGPKGRKDPLKIGGPKTIEKRINKIKGPDFPKWGGPKSKFVKVKEKCKKFPYCNQGDTGAIKIFNEALEKTSEKYGISPNEVLKIVLNTNR